MCSHRVSKIGYDKGMPSAFDRAALALLKSNRRHTDGHTYTLPSPQNYPSQWLWDSCFHATVLRHFDLDWAKEELKSVVARQFPNGMLPHMIYWTPTEQNHPAWGPADTSSITQPPIIAEAVWKVYNEDHDSSFLELMYPHLKYFYQYLLTERDVRENHLIGIINPDESGEDNSPRFDVALKLNPIHTLDENYESRLRLVSENKSCDFDAKHCMKNFFWVKDVPFNVLMVKNLQTMAQISHRLGHEQDTQFFKNQANLIKKAMKEFMYEDGIYWSVFDPEYRKIKLKTWAIFSPMYAGMCSAQEAKELIDEHLLNRKEFWLHYPVPTVAMDEQSFDPHGFWRGPTWIATNWFIFHGLLDYGYIDLAKQIYKISKELITKEGFREQFNPLTGEGQGATNFTWGTLVVDMDRTLKKL